MATTTWADVFDIPPEVCSRKLPLVALSGLNVEVNASHREVWDAMNCNSAASSALINLKLLEPTHVFPSMKPKKSSYEWYNPRGILKRNWILKHTRDLPALVVLFFDLDWNDPNFATKKTECASRLQIIRSSLRGRATRLSLVLLQRTAPVPGEDPSVTDKASSLCQACELNTKYLFVLPLGSHVQGYILRLEKAFLDLAQNYYHLEIRSVKAHREDIHKNTQQYLMVRHLFKMAFFSELKQDNATALKLYSQAYSHLLDLRVPDAHLMESKVVAGLINYLMSRLHFAQNSPVDAINQFRSHMDNFKFQVGPPELEFEHHGWLSKQLWMFGDLFDEAVKQGSFDAVQTQHPGFYYKQAAEQVIQRKLVGKKVCEDVKVYPNPDPLAGADSVEYFGQRPWRVNQLSQESADPTREKDSSTNEFFGQKILKGGPPVETLDPVQERNGILALQYREKHSINHSSIIITLFGIAIAQFKLYRCPRMRRQLLVEMAEEYYISGEYVKSLLLLTHLLSEYQTEKWWRLLTVILLRALRCAYLTASLEDYIYLSLVALGSPVDIAASEKTRIFNNLMSVLKKIPPQPEPNTESTAVPQAAELWVKGGSRQSGTMDEVIVIKMNSLTSCFECKARFSQAQNHVDQPLIIEVNARNRCPHPIQFSGIFSTITTPGKTLEVAADSEPAMMIFLPGQMKRFTCKVQPDVKHDNQEVQISSILLHLGDETSRKVILSFACPLTEDISAELHHLRRSSPNMPDLDTIRPRSTALLVPRHSLLILQVSHESPALLGELYPIHVHLRNTEESIAEKLSLEINLLLSPDDQHQERSTQLCENANGENMSIPLTFSIGEIHSLSETTVQFCLRAHSVGSRNLVIKAKYCIQGSSCWSAREEVVTVPVVKPFDVRTNLLSLQLEPLVKAFAREPLVLMPHTECLSPWPLVIHKSSLELAPNVSFVDKEMISQLNGLRLQKEEIAAEAIALFVKLHSEQPLALGVYHLVWSRVGSEDLQTSSSVTLPTLKVEASPLLIEMVLPAHGWVRTPMAVSYKITNHTSRLIDLDLSMEASDAFMYAGHKQLQLNLLPESVRTLEYNLYPLLSGLVALPRLCLSVVKDGELNMSQAALTELLQRCLPTHIYVMPQAKRKPNAPEIPVIS